MPNTLATGVAYADPEFTTCYASQELGYSVAAQGTVTQLTSKSTAVTLNKSAGRIIVNNEALASTSNASFTLNNSLITPNDLLILNVSANATAGAYCPYVSSLTNGSAVITYRNFNATSLSEAFTLNFAILHCLP